MDLPTRLLVYDGVSHELQVQAGGAKTWIEHSFGSYELKNVQSARLTLYVKDINKSGSIVVYHAPKEIQSFENNTIFDELKTEGLSPSSSIFYRAKSQ